MSSIWGHLETITDDGARSLARYQADPRGPDVGSILAAARNELPFIDRSRLSFAGKIGSGSTFEVSREVFSPPGSEKDEYVPGHKGPYYVAVKSTKLANKNEQKRRQLMRNVMREIRVMMHPTFKNHICIAPLMAYGWDDDPRIGATPYLITHYALQGALDTYLQTYSWTPEDRQDLVLDVGIGLAALHASGICHGDVKQANVLVYSYPTWHGLPKNPTEVRQAQRAHVAKLADFGAVIFADDPDASVSAYLGTPLYCPPELQPWSTSSKFSFDMDSCYKADIYSFGLLLWEVMNNGRLFTRALLQDGETNPLQVLQQLYESGDGLCTRALEWCAAQEFPWSVDFGICHGMDCCLRDDPLHRLDLEYVLDGLKAGTTLMRPPASYPHEKWCPPRLQKRTGPLADIPPGYQVNSDEPYVAIPQRGFVDPPYIQRYHVEKKKWEKTTELHEFDPRPPGLKLWAGPKVAKRGWVNPQSLDMFEITASTSPPWDAQCAFVDRAKTDARYENNKHKKAIADLQLSVCYHIGFGCTPDATLMLTHLQRASKNNELAANMLNPVAAALDTDVAIDQSMRKLDLEKMNFDYLTIVRQSAMLDYIEPEEHHLENRIPEAAVRFELTKTCREGSFEKACALVEGSSSSAAVDWSTVWPTPMHWLIQFPAEQAEYLIKKLLSSIPQFTDSAPMAAFEVLTEEIMLVPGFGVELFGTALHWAAILGHTELANLLLHHGANINVRWRKVVGSDAERDTQGLLSYSALDLAAMWHHSDMVTLLLQRGAETHGGNYWETHSATCLLGSPLKPLARQARHGSQYHRALVSTIAAFRKFGCNVDAETTEWDYDAKSVFGEPTPLPRKAVGGKNALEIAFSHCDQDDYVLEELIKASSEKAKQRLAPELLITIAKDAKTRRCSKARLQRALEVTGEVNAVDVQEKSALHYATEAGSSTMVETLLCHAGIDANLSMNGSPSPLALAATSGFSYIAELLLNAGALADATDSQGKAPLFHALTSKHIDMAALLINAGADIFFEARPPGDEDEDNDSRTVSALCLATADDAKGVSILAPLLQACLRLQDTDVLNFVASNEWTALHYAVWYGDYDGVRALLDAGANPHFHSHKKMLRRQLVGTPCNMAKTLSKAWSQLDHNGWKGKPIPWIAKGDAALWKSYLARLNLIVTRLEGVGSSS